MVNELPMHIALVIVKEQSEKENAPVWGARDTILGGTIYGVCLYLSVTFFTMGILPYRGLNGKGCACGQYGETAVPTVLLPVSAAVQTALPAYVS